MTPYAYMKGSFLVENILSQIYRILVNDQPRSARKAEQVPQEMRNLGSSKRFYDNCTIIQCSVSKIPSYHGK